AIAPANESADCCAQGSPIGANNDLTHHIAVGEWKCLEPAAPIPSQVTAVEAKPNAFLRIGREGRSIQSLSGRDVLSHVEIGDADQPLWISEGHRPDTVLPILGQRPDCAERSAVAAVDEAERAALIDGQSVVNADPQAAGMILEHRSHGTSRQSFAFPE